MNNSKLRSFFAILVVALAMFSCSKAPEQAKFIPKDANVVLSFDVKSLATKSGDFKGIFSLNTFKKLLSKDSSEQKIRNSGIDFLNKAFVFASITPEGNNSYGGLVVALSDEAKFESFVKSLDANATISTEGEVKIASIKEDNGVIAWKKGTAILLGQDRSASTKIKDKVVSLFNLKPEESLAENKNFADLQKQSSDISFWLSFESLMKMAAKAETSTNFISSIDFKDTYVNALCNFENGQVVVDTKMYGNKDITDKLNFYKTSLAKEVTEAAIGKSMVAMYGSAFDMEKLYAFLEKQKLTASLEENVKITGLTAKELMTTFTGDIVATFNGFTMKDVKSFDYETNQEVMKKSPSPDFGIVIGIANKDNFAKLLATATQLGQLVKKDNYYATVDESFILVDKGTYIVVSTGALKQSEEKLKSEQASLLSSNASALYLNFQTALSTMPEEYKGLMNMFVGESVRKNLENMEALTISSSAMSGDISEGKFVLSFKNKEENSLVSIAKISDEIAAKAEESMRPSYVEPMDADTTAAPIPMVEEVQ